MPMPPDRGDAARQPGGAVDGGSLRRVLAIFDFVLSDEDMAELDSLDESDGAAHANERKWW
jgi:diketogulonate reductase-like aldo/keto reductase